MIHPRIMTLHPHNQTNHDTSRRPKSRRLGDVLVERGVLTPQQLELALQHQCSTTPAKQLGRIVIDMQLASTEQVVEALAQSLDLPYAHLIPEMVHADAMACLPRELLEQHNLLPLSMTAGVLVIAMEQFTNLFLIEDIARLAQCRVEPVAATPENIRATRRSVHDAVTSRSAAIEPPGDGLREVLSEIDVDDLKVVERDEKVDEADLLAGAADSPVVKLVNFIIKHAAAVHASDIHIEPEEANFRVRYRVDGDLIESVRPNRRLLPPVVSRIKIMAGMDISQRRVPQDGSMTVTLGDRSIDLRVSTMTAKIGETVVMRLIDREADVRRLDVLGFETGMLTQFRALIAEPNGMVLVTGPTGSGKTTTLYAALAETISNKVNVNTIEDPVERRLAGANQFQVHPQAGFSFASALRSMLRQDPDVIMVGEIRDSETAKLATEAALTGHLVLSTLHTNSAPAAIPRLVNMGVEPYLVAACLRGVLAQRLVRRLCERCRSVSRPSEAQREALAAVCHPSSAPDAVFASAGCAHCHHVGTIGRVGIFEQLVLDEDTWAAMARDPGALSLHRVAARNALVTLAQDGLCKLRAGLIGVGSLLKLVSSADVISSKDQPLRHAA